MRSICSAVAVLALLLMVACGGGGGGGSTPELPHPTPLFVSTPVTSANEGSAYTYKLAATTADGALVSFTLTGAPTGATLTGDTISWTPTAAQSRVKNDFSVKATRSNGTESATQSWSVTPSGTVKITQDITVWSVTGSNILHTSGVLAGSIYLLYPQSDGSLHKLTGAMSNDNTAYLIPNVPGGYFWLVAGPNSYWSNSSSIDLSYDAVSSILPIISEPGDTRTTFNVDLSGLDPIQPGGELIVAADPAFAPLGTVLFDVPFGTGGIFEIPQPGSYQIGGTTFHGTVQSPITGIDYSSIEKAFVAQYNPVAIGGSSVLTLGPSMQISNPAWTTGATNDLSGSLTAGQSNSFDLNVKGSVWSALPSGTGTPQVPIAGSYFGRSVLPYVAQANTIPHAFERRYPLVAPQGLIALGPSSNCGLGSGFSTWWSGQLWNTYDGYPQPPRTTDAELGTISYSDPFSTEWNRIFSFCQGTSVKIAIPDSNYMLLTEQEYGLESVTVPNPVVPLVGPIQNATINGGTLASPSTIASANPTLSWSAPTVGSPIGYRVRVFDLNTLPTPGAGNSGGFSIPQIYNTAKTSVTVPLTPGHTYVFEIASVVDAGAKIETSPNRSALPRGYATAISAPITVDSAAAPVVIQ